MRAYVAFLTALLLGLITAPAYAAADCASFGVGWKIDGLFGGYTRQAVTQFQRANRLQVDGIAGPQTLKALHRPFRGTLRCGTSGAEVRRLQQALAARGYWRDGRAHAAARVAMARHARIAAARPKPVLVRRHHVAPRLVSKPKPRPQQVVVRPRPQQPLPVRTPPSVARPPVALAPRPKPPAGGWQEPVPFVVAPQPVPSRKPLPALPHQFSRPAAEVVPIEVITPPPSFPIFMAPPAPPQPQAVELPTPTPFPAPRDLPREAEAPPTRVAAAPPAPVATLPPTRAGPTPPPLVEAHGGGWLAARGANFSTTVPVLSGDATVWLGDWGLLVAATNVDAPPTAAQIFDLAAARRLGPCQVSIGYQGIGPGQAHMAAVGASVEQPLGMSWLEGHAGLRAATNLNDFTADAHAGLGVQAGPAALEAGLRALVLRSAGANIPDPTDFEGPYIQLRIRL